MEESMNIDVLHWILKRLIQWSSELVPWLSFLLFHFVDKIVSAKSKDKK
jgi:hypothetical protein